MTYKLCSVNMYIFSFCIFFFKQKTAYEMRISDWSSDVCSSDLRQNTDGAIKLLGEQNPHQHMRPGHRAEGENMRRLGTERGGEAIRATDHESEIGNADRKSVV